MTVTNKNQQKSNRQKWMDLTMLAAHSGWLLLLEGGPGLFLPLKSLLLITTSYFSDVTFNVSQFLQLHL
jgi:hypothetical protein